MPLGRLGHMDFWRLSHPAYESDYLHSHINGTLEHPFRLPGVRCDVCGATWAGSRILPFECPASMRDRAYLRESWPIDLETHKSLQAEVRAELEALDIAVSRLQPGDDFQPAYLDVPSTPKADFLWCNIGSVVVSSRVRQELELLHVTDVAFCEVRLRKIGNRAPELQPPVPSSGEPEDVINEVPLLAQVDGVGPYFEMIILSESGYPPGGEPAAVCEDCGRESIDSEARKLMMLPSMWKGADIFFMATTLHIVITERVMESLRELGVTNIELAKYQSA